MIDDVMYWHMLLSHAWHELVTSLYEAKSSYGAIFFHLLLSPLLDLHLPVNASHDEQPELLIVQFLKRKYV